MNFLLCSRIEAKKLITPPIGPNRSLCKVNLFNSGVIRKTIKGVKIER